jgi:anti-sigma regulatory factor (Ser/Thr protein kinase)
VSEDTSRPATGGRPAARGLRHELLLHASDDELLDVVVPFLLDGVDGGEAVFVGGDDRRSALVRAHIAPGRDVTYLPEAGGRTARGIADLVNRFAYLAANGVAGIRVVGHVPHRDGGGGTWAPWSAYEAVLNHTEADLPVWAICPFDLRTAPPEVVADARRAHPRLAAPSGGRPNAAYVEPERFLRDLPAGPPDPLEADEPTVELADVRRAHVARAAVRQVAAELFEPEPLEDLIVAVGEVTSNALAHGVGPVAVRLWAGPSRVVVTVHDRGPGPKDPRLGLLPPRPMREGGYGLWIARQYSDRLDIEREQGGCTVRLVAQASALPVTC